MHELANDVGFNVKKIGEMSIKKPHIVFGAYELRRKR
jgi:hypothetical protein